MYMFVVQHWRILLILLGTLALVASVAWFIYRRDYRLLQKMYKVKLPFLCHVTLVREPDKIIWGKRRHRFLKKDGGKDKRYSFNIKWSYPTVIVINRFKCVIWNLDKARAVMRVLEPYMELPLEKIQFLGRIQGDPVEFFNRSNVVFIRWCAKLFSFYGYRCELSGYKGCNAMCFMGGKVYAMHCELRYPDNHVDISDFNRLPPISEGVQWIFITNSSFSDLALKYAFRHGILCMDGACLDRTFKYEKPMFL